MPLTRLCLQIQTIQGDGSGLRECHDERLDAALKNNGWFIKGNKSCYFSYVQLIIGNPCGDGLIELQVETGLQLLIHPLPLNIKHHFYSPTGVYFLLILSLMVFLFLGLCFPASWGECVFWVPEVIMMACLLASLFCSTMPHWQTRLRENVGNSFVERNSSGIKRTDSILRHI